MSEDNSGGTATQKGMEYQQLCLIYELLCKDREVAVYEGIDDYDIVKPEPKRIVQAKAHGRSQQGRLSPSWFFNEVLDNFEEIFLEEDLEGTKTMLILRTDGFFSDDLKSQIFDLGKFGRDKEYNVNRVQATDRRKFQKITDFLDKCSQIQNKDRAFNLLKHIRGFDAQTKDSLEAKVKKKMTEMGSSETKRDLSTLRGFISNKTGEEISRDMLIEEVGLREYSSSSYAKSKVQESNNVVESDRNRIENIRSLADEIKEASKDIEDPTDKTEDALESQKESSDNIRSSDIDEMRQTRSSIIENKRNLQQKAREISQSLDYVGEDLNLVEDKNEKIEGDIDE